MTEDDETLFRNFIHTLWSTADEVDEAVDLIVEFVATMHAEEISIWKDRLAAERQAHEATIKHFEDEARGDW